MQHARWKAMGGQENSLLGGLNVGDQLETVISYTKRICHQTCVLQTRILVYWVLWVECAIYTPVDPTAAKISVVDVTEAIQNIENKYNISAIATFIFAVKFAVLLVLRI